MPFELIMLLGFFGTVLLSLLPATPAKTSGEGFRSRPHSRRSDRGGETVRHARMMKRGETIRRRRAGHAAA